MIGAFTGFLVFGLLGGVNPIIAVVVAIVAAAVVGALINMGIDRIGYRPIRGSQRIMPLISGIGLYIFLENLSGLIFGREPKAYPAFFPGGQVSLGPVVMAQDKGLGSRDSCSVVEVYEELGNVRITTAHSRDSAEPAST